MDEKDDTEAQEPASLEPRQAEQLPPMTEHDMHVIVHLLTSAATLGVTRMEFHPARWRMILDNILNHGVYPAGKLHWMGPVDNTVEDYSRVSVPIMFTVNDGLLTCMLMQRQPHDDEGEYGEAIDSQGSIYPKPDEMTEDEKVQERARDAGIVIPFPNQKDEEN